MLVSPFAMRTYPYICTGRQPSMTCTSPKVHCDQLCQVASLQELSCYGNVIPMSTCWSTDFPRPSHQNSAVDGHGMDNIDRLIMDTVYDSGTSPLMNGIFNFWVGILFRLFQWDYLSTQLRVPEGATPQHPKWDGKASRMGYSNESEHRSSHCRDRRFDEDIKKREEETRQKAGWRWLRGGLPHFLLQMLFASSCVTPRSKKKSHVGFGE